MIRTTRHDVTTSHPREVCGIVTVRWIWNTLVTVEIVHEPIVFGQIIDGDIVAEETVHDVTYLIDVGDVASLRNLMSEIDWVQMDGLLDG